MPTGFGSANVAGFLTLLQIACGRIGTPAICCRLVYCAEGKVSVTVLPEVLTLLIASPPRLIDAFFFTRL